MQSLYVYTQLEYNVDKYIVTLYIIIHHAY